MMPRSAQTPADRASLVINAGGQSRRMGQDKALMPMPDTGEPLIRHIVRRLAPLIEDQLIVVTNSPAVMKALAEVQGDVHFFRDAYPGSGALGGLATGLAACSGWAVCVACDMPLIQPAIFRHLRQVAGQRDDLDRERWDVVIPTVADRYQTHHALYHRRCLPAMQARLAAGHYRIIDFFPAVRVRVVDEAELRPLDPTLRSFLNVNTPEDWAAVSELLGQGVT